MSSFKKSPTKVIFNATSVAAHFKALKAAADREDWWRPALNIEWHITPRSSANCGWTSIYYTDESGIHGKLILRVNNERCIGSIMPNTDAGVAELTATNRNPKFTPKKRTLKPCIQIQKWNVKVQTAEDDISPLTDASGNPITPSDEHLSAYYAVAAVVHEAFIYEGTQRLDKGNALFDMATKMKKANKDVTAQEILEAFVAAEGPRTFNDAILEQGRVATLRKFPGGDLLIKGVISTPKASLTNLVQEFIAERATSNAGKPLPNPITRAVLPFDPETGVAKFKILDKSTPFKTASGTTSFDPAKVDGEPVDNDNVHKFVTSGCVIDGLINMADVCFSSLSISIPVKVDIIIVERSTGRVESDVDDVYGFDSLSIAPAAPREPAASAGAAAVNEDDDLDEADFD